MTGLPEQNTISSPAACRARTVSITGGLGRSQGTSRYSWCPLMKRPSGRVCVATVPSMSTITAGERTAAAAVLISVMVGPSFRAVRLFSKRTLGLDVERDDRPEKSCSML